LGGLHDFNHENVILSQDHRYRNVPVLKFSTAAKIFGNILLVSIAVLIFLPVVLAVLYSCLPSGLIPNIRSLKDIADNFTLQGYRNVFRQVPFLRIMGNSVFLSLISTSLQLTVAFLTAYALTHWDYPGSDYIFGFIIIVMIIPSVALYVPNYMTVSGFGMVNKFSGVVVPGIANAYGIFLMRQFFKKVPKSLIEACWIDGVSELHILWHIYLPICRSAVIALFIILLVTNWNDYQWPMLMLHDPAKLTLPLALVRFRDEGVIEWGPTAAACLMTTVPIMLVYIFMQRQMLETFASSVTKE
jgi:multiple sugar transport system permease protein/sn-glycerol 3-phosphate transport system permease protein